VVPQKNIAPVGHDDLVVGGDHGGAEKNVNPTPGEEVGVMAVFPVKLVLAVIPSFQDDRYRHTAFPPRTSFFRQSCAAYCRLHLFN
jgi:hypothetical protein